MENRDKSRRRLRLSKMLTIACVLVCAAGVGVGDATPSYIKGFVDMYRMVGPLSKLPPLTIGGLTDEEKQSLDGGLKFVSELSNLASDHLIVGSHNASEVAHHGLQSALHFAEKTIVEGAKLAERGLEILDEIEKKAPHYAGTVRNVVPLVGGRSVADVKTDVLALPGRFVPTLNNVVGKSHYLVEQVRSFFEKFVNVTNDIIQIILAMIRLAVTGELGEVEKYEKDLMQRTTGTSSAPGRTHRAWSFDCARKNKAAASGGETAIDGLTTGSQHPEDFPHKGQRGLAAPDSKKVGDGINENPIIGNGGAQITPERPAGYTTSELSPSKAAVETGSGLGFFTDIWNTITGGLKPTDNQGAMTPLGLLASKIGWPSGARNYDKNEAIQKPPGQGGGPIETLKITKPDGANQPGFENVVPPTDTNSPGQSRPTPSGSVQNVIGKPQGQEGVGPINNLKITKPGGANQLGFETVEPTSNNNIPGQTLVTPNGSVQNAVDMPQGQKGVGPINNLKIQTKPDGANQSGFKIVGPTTNDNIPGQTFVTPDGSVQNAVDMPQGQKGVGPIKNLKTAKQDEDNHTGFEIMGSPTNIDGPQQISAAPDGTLHVTDKPLGQEGVDPIKTPKITQRNYANQPGLDVVGPSTKNNRPEQILAAPDGHTVNDEPLGQEGLVPDKTLKITKPNDADQPGLGSVGASVNDSPQQVLAAPRGPHSDKTLGQGGASPMKTMRSSKPVKTNQLGLEIEAPSTNNDSQDQTSAAPGGPPNTFSDKPLGHEGVSPIKTSTISKPDKANQLGLEITGPSTENNGPRQISGIPGGHNVIDMPLGQDGIGPVKTLKIRKPDKDNQLGLEIEGPSTENNGPQHISTIPGGRNVIETPLGQEGVGPVKTLKIAKPDKDNQLGLEIEGPSYNKHRSQKTSSTPGGPLHNIIDNGQEGVGPIKTFKTDVPGSLGTTPGDSKFGVLPTPPETDASTSQRIPKLEKLSPNKLESTLSITYPDGAHLQNDTESSLIDPNFLMTAFETVGNAIKTGARAVVNFVAPGSNTSEGSEAYNESEPGVESLTAEDTNPLKMEKINLSKGPLVDPSMRTSPTVATASVHENDVNPESTTDSDTSTSVKDGPSLLGKLLKLKGASAQLAIPGITLQLNIDPGNVDQLTPGVSGHSPTGKISGRKGHLGEDNQASDPSKKNVFGYTVGPTVGYTIKYDEGSPRAETSTKILDLHLKATEQSLVAAPQAGTTASIPQGQKVENLGATIAPQAGSVTAGANADSNAPQESIGSAARGLQKTPHPSGIDTGTISGSQTPEVQSSSGNATPLENTRVTHPEGAHLENDTESSKESSGQVLQTVVNADKAGASGVSDFTAPASKKSEDNADHDESKIEKSLTTEGKKPLEKIKIDTSKGDEETGGNDPLVDPSMSVSPRMTSRSASGEDVKKENATEPLETTSNQPGIESGISGLGNLLKPPNAVNQISIPAGTLQLNAKAAGNVEKPVNVDQLTPSVSIGSPTGTGRKGHLVDGDKANDPGNKNGFISTAKPSGESTIKYDEGAPRGGTTVKMLDLNVKATEQTPVANRVGSPQDMTVSMPQDIKLVGHKGGPLDVNVPQADLVISARNAPQAASTAGQKPASITPKAHGLVNDRSSPDTVAKAENGQAGFTASPTADKDSLTADEKDLLNALTMISSGAREILQAPQSIGALPASTMARFQAPPSMASSGEAGADALKSSDNVTPGAKEQRKGLPPQLAFLLSGALGNSQDSGLANIPVFTFKDVVRILGKASKAPPETVQKVENLFHDVTKKAAAKVAPEDKKQIETIASKVSRLVMDKASEQFQADSAMPVARGFAVEKISEALKSVDLNSPNSIEANAAANGAINVRPLYPAPPLRSSSAENSIPQTNPRFSNIMKPAVHPNTIWAPGSNAERTNPYIPIRNHGFLQ